MSSPAQHADLCLGFPLGGRHQPGPGPHRPPQMTDDIDIRTEPDGAWWTWPLWRKALAMATLRPYCLVLGYLAMVRQAVALRFPNRPFHPVAWVHREPCSMEWCDEHDEHHVDRDDCVKYGEWVEHGLEYERDLDVPRALADNFDIRVGRMYRWIDLDEGAEAA